MVERGKPSFLSRRPSAPVQSATALNMDKPSTPVSDLSEYTPRAAASSVGAVHSFKESNHESSAPNVDLGDDEFHNPPQSQTSITSPPVMSSKPPTYADTVRPKLAVPKLGAVRQKPKSILLDIGSPVGAFRKVDSEDSLDADNHICSAGALFVIGLILGFCLNGFALLLGTLIDGKRRRNYVVGCALGAVTQLALVITAIVRAVPMFGPTGMILVRK